MIGRPLWLAPLSEAVAAQFRPSRDVRGAAGEEGEDLGGPVGRTRSLSPGRGEHIKYPEFSFSGQTPVAATEKGQVRQGSAQETYSSPSCLELDSPRGRGSRAAHGADSAVSDRMAQVVHKAAGSLSHVEEQFLRDKAWPPLPPLSLLLAAGSHVCELSSQSTVFPIQAEAPSPGVMIASNGKGLTGVRGYDKDDHLWGEEVGRGFASPAGVGVATQSLCRSLRPQCTLIPHSRRSGVWRQHPTNP